MCNFIEEYLQNLSQAVTNARLSAKDRFIGHDYCDDLIYSQIQSPEFILYEEITIFAVSKNKETWQEKERKRLQE